MLSIECTGVYGREGVNLKKNIFILIVIISSLFLSACSLKCIFSSSTLSNLIDDSNLPKGYYYDDNGNLRSIFDTLTVPLELEKNYEIYTNDADIANIYHYYVKDNSGNIIDEGYHNWRGNFNFSFKDDLLILNYGFGGNYSWQERYYDVENSRISRFYQTPLKTSDELIAYFIIKDERPLLIVQNVFDKSVYYKEIKKDFSMLVMRDTSPTEFLNNNKQIKISYWAEPDNRIVTEIIDL